LAADIGFSFPSLRLHNPNFDAGSPLDNLRIVSSDFQLGKQQHESSSSDLQHGKQQHELRTFTFSPVHLQQSGEVFGDYLET
jgi:hypothetical protein